GGEGRHKAGPVPPPGPRPRGRPRSCPPSSAPLLALRERPDPQRQEQIEARIGVLEVDTGHLTDPPQPVMERVEVDVQVAGRLPQIADARSEEHTSELQS